MKPTIKIDRERVREQVACDLYIRDCDREWKKI